MTDHDILEDLKNEDIQIKARIEYYNNLSDNMKELGQKGIYTRRLCYCNKFYNNGTVFVNDHKEHKQHKDYYIKIKNEEKLIQEKSPEYVLVERFILYKNQLIDYYFFAKK
jgi:hypothetical protein